MTLARDICIGFGVGVSGICIGMAIASTIPKFSQIISIAGLSALPTAFVVGLVADTKAVHRIQEVEKQSDVIARNLKKSELNYQAERKRAERLSGQLAELQVTHQRLTTELKAISDTLKSAQHDKEVHLRQIAELQSSVEYLQGQLNKAKENSDYLVAEVQEWEQNFHTRVEFESDKKFKTAKSQEIQKIFDEHDQITQQAMALFRQLQSWGEKVAHGHNSKREIIKGLATAYNSNLDEINQAIEQERAGYIEQIELLNEKVGRLQQELAGELLEPVYGDFGFDINGKIANEIARTLFSDINLALSVKGFQVKPDGVVDIGYGYSRSVDPQAVVEAIKKHSETLAKKLGLFKITSVRKLEITDCIVVGYRTEPAIKTDEIKLMVGTADEFISYVVSHPIRYRLIADPGMGKTPTTAVMISEILKAGCTRGNTGKGEKVPYTLVNVSYPGAIGSLKDSSYPLDVFLQYGDTTAAIKSFEDCLDDGKFRLQNTQYAAKFFQIWTWEELDNTLNSCSDPYKAGGNLKHILKQFGHNNIGWIVSGQSVMTKQIPGFTNDDRSLFTEIIIGIPKIRHYLNTYGKGKNSESNLAKLTRNLDAIEEYIDHKNELVTDDARLLRVALVVDSRSPKLYFLPNLDRVNFNYQEIEEVKRLARLAKASGTVDTSLTQNSSKPYSVRTGTMAELPPFSTIGGSYQSGTSPHCPHCGSANLKLQTDKRYRCLDCKKRTVANKIVWR